MNELKKPNLFVVGMPKTGTTALYYFLKQHPEIYVPREKEINYFATDLKEEKYAHDAILEKYFQLPENDYLKFYEDVREEPFRVDVTPVYLYSKIAAKKIYQFDPQARIIAILREPVDFMFSLHSEYVFDITETEKDFLKALELEESRKKTGGGFSYLYYSEWVRYAKLLESYLKCFPREQIHVVFFEEFKKDNTKTFKEIEKFLGIEEAKEMAFKSHNLRKVTRFVFLKNIVESPRFWITAKNLLPENLLELLKKIYYKIVNKHEIRKELDPETITNLKRRFMDNIVRFEKLLKEHEFIEKDFDLLKFWGYDKL